MRNPRKRLLLTVILLLPVAISGSPREAVADSYADVYAYINWLSQSPDWGDRTNSDSMTYYYRTWIALGQASTAGTVKLLGQSGLDYMYVYADVHDHYMFSNLDNPDATGTISGLYARITYSGILSTGGGDSSFRVTNNQITLSRIAGGYRLTTYTPSTGNQHEYFDESGSTQNVSGTFVFPVTANYGIATPLTMNYKLYVFYGGIALSYADFYNTATLSFFSTNIPNLGVTSEGGFESGSSTVPEPTTILLLGTGLGVTGLVRWRCRR